MKQPKAYGQSPSKVTSRACVPSLKSGVPLRAAVFFFSTSACGPIQKLWGKPAVLVISKRIVSPFLTSTVSGTKRSCAFASSVTVRAFGVGGRVGRAGRGSRGARSAAGGGRRGRGRLVGPLGAARGAGREGEGDRRQ